MVSLLDDWVRLGRAPDDDRIRDAFGARTGLNLQFEPGPWPGERSMLRVMNTDVRPTSE